MASLKIIRRRIASVKSTQQITKAMQMIAAAKLRRAQEAATQARPYADKLTALLRTVASRVEEGSNPLLAVRDEERTVDLILVSSDRGLCGGFNANLLRRAQNFLAEKRESRIRLTLIGNKALGFYKKRGGEIFEDHTGLRAGPDQPLAMQIGGRVARDYRTGETDAVYVLYNHFKSAMTQVPTLDRLLPVVPESSGEEPLVDYIYEPNPAALLDRLLVQYINTLIYRAFLESNASEHAARMTSMESATSNASEMIDRLTLAMNRARQAAITTELMEIVSGAEALKG
jgi:F-type H+-transporting ATPase subunit gamma